MKTRTEGIFAPISPYTMLVLHFCCILILVFFLLTDYSSGQFADIPSDLVSHCLAAACLRESKEQKTCNCDCQKQADAGQITLVYPADSGLTETALLDLTFSTLQISGNITYFPSDDLGGNYYLLRIIIN